MVQCKFSPVGGIKHTHTHAQIPVDVSMFHRKPFFATLDLNNFPQLTKMSRCGRWNRDMTGNDIDRLWHADRIRADDSEPGSSRFGNTYLFFNWTTFMKYLVCCVPCYRTNLLMKTPPCVGARLPLVHRTRLLILPTVCILAGWWVFVAPLVGKQGVLPPIVSNGWTQTCKNCSFQTGAARSQGSNSEEMSGSKDRGPAQSRSWVKPSVWEGTT